MVLADIRNVTQSDSGINWSSLSAITNEDSRYAYAVLNGFHKEKGKPKTIDVTAQFDLDAYDYDTDEFFIEYKLYVDDVVEALDGLSLLKMPDVVLTFYNGEQKTVEQDGYCNDNMRDDNIVKYVKFPDELSLDLLNNPFTISLAFESIDSVENQNITVYCDYIRARLTTSLPSDPEWHTHFIPSTVIPQGGFTFDAGFGEKEYGAYGEFDSSFDLPIGYSYYFNYRTRNLRDDEYTIIELGEGMVLDEDKAIETENCRLDYDRNTHTIRIYSSEKTKGTLKFYIKATQLYERVVYTTTNYHDFTRAWKFHVSPPLIDDDDASIRGLVSGNKLFLQLNNLSFSDSFVVYSTGKSFLYATVKDRDGNDLPHSPITVTNLGRGVKFSEGSTTYNITSKVTPMSDPLTIKMFSGVIPDDEVDPSGYDVQTVTIDAYDLTPASTYIHPVPTATYLKSNYPIDIFVGLGADTLPLVADKGNYFKFDKPTNTIQIAKDIAYIGAVQLSRGHKADVTGNTTNASSSESYQNRKYLGKTGDWKEDIGMTLRIPWKDVVTLQNHVYHDAPIPINTCPDLPDGDPLNHRGWAEIYGVKNIKKINEFLYQCEPEVEYLTHELLGKFTVQLLNRVCPKDIQSIIHTAHDYGHDLRDIMDLSVYKQFYNLEIDEKMYKGVYTVDDDNTFIFRTKDKISTICDWSFRWRNLLETIDSQAHDDNRWQMAFRVKDHDTDELLFEYLYHNFKHMNDNDELLNECDVQTTVLNANDEYEVSNYTHMNLDFDDVSASEYNNKANTTLKVQQTIEAFERGHNVAFYLVDWYGNPLINRFVDVNVFEEDGEEIQSFTVLTNSDGKGDFEFNQNKGNYLIQYKFMGDNNYNECYAESELYMNITQSTKTFLDVADNQIFTEKGQYFVGTLMTYANQILIGEKVEIFMKEGASGKWTSTPWIRTTDSSGQFKIAINSHPATYYVRCRFEGHDQYTTSQKTVKIKVTQRKGTKTKLQTSDLTVPYTDSINKTYSFDAILKDNKNKVLANKPITFTIYSPRSKNTKTINATTNSKGVASANIQLNTGIYYIDTSFDGETNKYWACNNTNQIVVKARELMNTKLVMRDMNITTCHHYELGATLYDEEDNILQNYPVRFEITMPSGKVVKYTVLTNYMGMAELNINFQPTGTYICRAKFDKQDRYNSTSTKSTMYIKRPDLLPVTVKTDHTTYASNQPIYITVTDNDDEPLPSIPMSIYFYEYDTCFELDCAKEVVTTFVKTTDTGEYETDSNGQVGIIPSLSEGEYMMRVITYCNTTHNPTDEMFFITLTGNTKEATHFVKQWIGDDYETYPYSKSYMRVRLVDSDNIALAKSIVMFKYGQNTYPKITDENGYASLLINNNAGRQPVTISYYGTQAYAPCTLSFYSDVDVSHATSPDIVPSKSLATLELLNEYETIEGGKYVDVNAFPHYSQVRLSLNNSPLPNKQVSFTVVGENVEENTYYRTTNAEGIATLEFLTHTNNVYPVTVKYDTDSQHAPDLYYNLRVDVEEIDISQTTPSEIIDRSSIVEGLTILETPDPSTYNGSEYGSTLDMAFDNNILNIHDYGLLQDTSTSGGKIAMNGITLRDGDYDIEVAVSYDAMDNLVQTMTGTMQVRVYETKDTLQYKSLYSKLFTAPVLLPNYVCKFTRDGEDGRTYYYDGTTNSLTKQYNLSPYLQYKGGVNIETEAGISLFSLNKAFSPIIMQNGFVKVAFHHRSGYVYIYKYRYDVDDNYVNHSEWVLIRILKINTYTPFELKEYSQDKASILFGGCTFTMWRGRPFIQVEHEKQTILFTRQVDRVFCEANRNEMIFDYVNDSDVDKDLAEFSTINGINMFPADAHIGQDIRVNNFIPMKEAVLSTPYEKDNVRALKISSENSSESECGVLFPRNYRIERPADVFSLLINRLKTNADTVELRLYGYESLDDATGDLVQSYDLSNEILHGGELNQVRKSFDVSNNDYKYFKFAVYFSNDSSDSYVIINELMLYKGDSTVPYEPDNYAERGDNSEIYFEDNYYANFYNDRDDFGLCVVRPYLDSLKLSKIPASKLTILIPYFKNATLYDTPAMMTVEYLYFVEEKTSMENGNYGI